MPIWSENWAQILSLRENAEGPQRRVPLALPVRNIDTFDLRKTLAEPVAHGEGSQAISVFVLQADEDAPAVLGDFEFSVLRF